MADPDIIATTRVGTGYLSTTFNDPTDLSITYRKWIFGDGIVVEGTGLSTINHTYYYPGIYEVRLIDQTVNNQYSVIKENYIVVNTFDSIPDFIIAQSFNIISGCYWRFYFDQYFYLVFEDESNIYRSKERMALSNQWIFVDFHRETEKMYMGSYNSYISEIELIKLINNNPVSVTSTKFEVAPNSNLKLDEMRIWSVNINTIPYYTLGRGRAGYLATIN